MGERIGQWADGLGGHRVRSIVMTTRRCSDPDDVLDAVADVRRRARQMLDRRQREDSERWGGLRLWAVAIPAYARGEWTATITGVVDLARAPEVAVEDALSSVTATRIRALANPLLARDVRAHIVRAISTTATIREAGPDGVAEWYSAVDRAGAGGWRAITWARGCRAGADR
ncbi:hypothetical protein VQ02_11695 [Methylobacterium variabile]|jgi:uncharacterized membrane protein|uniref:Uncharacterized protein n=1 Tax=Methylobacterium variabile TaxID=298794 RepID=A0A0J6VHN1_9HYPH|nr:hypothetical protein [Methylobacterium variabile]KMO38586.1 hypothetical protein VQ02_11695 [Methylobacterium variabile]